MSTTRLRIASDESTAQAPRHYRAKAAAGGSTRGPVHSAKQEITETVKFLVWLHETYERSAATCTQQDVDEWLATGPTTRTANQDVLRGREEVAPQHQGQHPASVSQDEPSPQPGSAPCLDSRAAHRHQ